MIVLDELKFEAPKTKEMVKVLENVKAGKKALIVTGGKGRKRQLSPQPTSPGVKTTLVTHDERLRDRQPRRASS